MNASEDKSAFKIILSEGLLPKEQLERFQQEAQQARVPLVDFLVNQGVIREEMLLSLFAQKMGTSVVNLKEIKINQDLFKKIPVKFAWYYKFFPVSLLDKRLTIAVPRILDVHTIDEIRFGLGFEIETVFAPRREIEEMLNSHYGIGAQTVDKIITQNLKNEPQQETVAPAETEENIERPADDASVIQLVNQIIFEAYKKGASDIHFEPYRGAVRLRYRIDGNLKEERVPPEMMQFLGTILSRIKIMANLNIVERRLPQDGKARVKTQDQALNLRVSSLPTAYGESMVVRILPSKMILSLDKLGFELNNQQTFARLIQKPHGIIFVTGPTGSGKSTTLYAGLHSLNVVERKIITLEDPIEYELAGITQVQVNPEIGLTFGRGLRSLLRHDPDVMMVGEVRDLETADIAIRAALTGHLMLSTLHTNDAATGITRLLDIGVEPFLVASSVIAFMAQRLIRTICPHCKEEASNASGSLLEHIRRDLGLRPEAKLKIYHGRGCEKCGGTGFHGRTSVHEILEVNEEIRQLIMTTHSADIIKQKAREFGMKTLRQDGWLKVLSGLTTPEEVIRVTPDDRPAAQREDLNAVSYEDMDQLDLTVEKSETGSGKPFAAEASATGSSLRERRKYARVDIHLHVIFRSVNLEQMQAGASVRESGWIGPNETSNISAGGVAIRSQQKFFPGDVLEIKISLPDNQGPIECLGKVLRVQELRGGETPDMNHFQLAIQFLAIHSVDRLRIENFCKERAQS